MNTLADRGPSLGTALVAVATLGLVRAWANEWARRLVQRLNTRRVSR